MPSLFSTDGEIEDQCAQQLFLGLLAKIKCILPRNISKTPLILSIRSELRRELNQEARLSVSLQPQHAGGATYRSHISEQQVCVVFCFVPY